MPFENSFSPLRGPVVTSVLVLGAVAGPVLPVVAQEPVAPVAPVAPPAPESPATEKRIVDLENQVEALRRQVTELTQSLQQMADLQKSGGNGVNGTNGTAPPTGQPPVDGGSAPPSSTRQTPSGKPPVLPPTAVTPTVQTPSRTPLNISGLIQIQGNAYFDQNNVPTGTARLSDGGRLRRGQLRLTLPNITPRITGFFMFDLAKTNNLTRTGSQLMDLIIGYRLDTRRTSPKIAEVGQFKIGFGYESDLVSSVDLSLIERSQIYSFRDLATLPSTAPLPGLSGGGLGNTRDPGVRLSGTFTRSKFNYNIGVFNGIGEGQNDVARGDAKAVVGRVFYGHRDSRNVVRGTAFGVSALTANNRRVSATGPLDRYAYNLFAGHLRDPERRKWQHDRLTYYGEYSVLKSKAKDEPETFKNGIGYYATLGYLFSPHFEVVGRYDSFKQQLSAGRGTSVEYSGGLNYYFQSYRDQGPKIQLNLVKVDGEPNALSTFDSFQLRTQYQIAF